MENSNDSETGSRVIAYKNDLTIICNDEFGEPWSYTLYEPVFDVDCPDANVKKDEKNFKCKSCPFSFSSKVELDTHQEIHQALSIDGTKRRYECDVCQYKFTRMDHLRRHKKIHTGEKPFSCTLCAYRSARRSHITRHMKTHRSVAGRYVEKGLSCDKCNFETTDLNLMEIHLRVHNLQNSNV